MFYNINTQQEYSDLPQTWQTQDGSWITGFPCLWTGSIDDKQRVYNEGFRELIINLPSVNAYQIIAANGYDVTDTQATKLYTVSYPAVDSLKSQRCQEVNNLRSQKLDANNSGLSAGDYLAAVYQKAWDHKGAIKTLLDADSIVTYDITTGW